MIHHADVLDALRAMPDNSFHGCLTDPPYGLSFMGHQWDHGVPSAEVWREVLRVLRPGAALLAFGGTRTFHRLTCAIEDAGFEVRDCLMWLYGSGFPKSLDVSKAIDREAGAVREVVGEYRMPMDSTAPGREPSQGLGYGSGAASCVGRPITAPATEAARQWEGHGTALKPAWEPIILARKPLEGTVAANVQRWGCGALAIDASRVGTTADERQVIDRRSGAGRGAMFAHMGREEGERFTSSPLGRWPANVIFDEEAGAVLDAQSGNRPSTLTGRADPAKAHAHPADPAKRRGSMFGNESAQASVYADSGGASRFFKQCDYTEEDARFMYCAKASRKERDAGLEGFEPSAPAHGYATLPDKRMDREQVRNNPRNVHPTVKPLALTTYLARLILPPVEGSRLLVPFCGSGSEMLGGTRAGWSHVEGIDSWDVAVKIARARTA